MIFRWHREDRDWKGQCTAGDKGVHLLGEKVELKQKDLDRVRDRPSSNLADPQAGQVGHYYKINFSNINIL